MVRSWGPCTRSAKILVAFRPPEHHAVARSRRWITLLEPSRRLRSTPCLAASALDRMQPQGSAAHPADYSYKLLERGVLWLVLVPASQWFDWHAQHAIQQHREP